MPGNSGAYAVKKRKKPAQKIAKPPPVKTNPSKRHRDRLNIQLDHLTSLLPFSEEVRGRLDKLSVLRLSVGYLKVKSYFHEALQKNRESAPHGRNGQSVSLDGVSFSEGELLLQALNGFVLVVTTDGTIFYTSPTVQDFLGFHQSDVVCQSVFDLVHVDDREAFRCQLHFALNPSESGSDPTARDVRCSSRAWSSSLSLLPQFIPPENSSFLERSFCCRLRCLKDNTSGFLALNFDGRLKYLQGNTGADGTAAPQLALFAIATPLQHPSVMAIRTKTVLFQTKHRMDFAPLGIDTRGKLVLGYSEVELVTTGSGYQFVHAADMMHCADNHLRMMKTGDSGFTFFRLLTKTGHWLWVQASARVVFKGGRPDFIIARQKALTNEEGEQHLHQRRQQLPFNLATGEGVLYDISLDVFSVPGPPGPPESTKEKPLDPASLLGALRRQDHSVYTQPRTQLPILSQIEDLGLEQAFLDSYALLSVPVQIQSSQNRSVTGDQTSEAMIDSLEQILRDIGDGGMEGIEVEETELRDWGNAVVRRSYDREDSSRELKRILANDVFSYVEEALRREAGGGSDQTGPRVSGNSSSVQRQHPGSVLSHEWQPVAGTASGFAEQTLLGDVLGSAGRSTGLKEAAPARCRDTQQGRSSNNQIISAQSCHAGRPQPDVTPPSWLPSAQNTTGLRSSRQRCTLNHAGSQRPGMDPELHSPSVWQQQQQQQQQQQLPQSFHHHTLTHSSHTAGVGSTARPLHPQTQQLSGSCMYKNREGHIPNAAAGSSRQNGPLLGPPRSTGAGVISQGALQSSGPSARVCTDVGTISLSGDNTGLGAARSEYPPEHGSLPSFLCWNGDAQIPKVPLNGAVDPFAFPAFPTGSVNLSQNTGP